MKRQLLFLILFIYLLSCKKEEIIVNYPPSSLPTFSVKLNKIITVYGDSSSVSVKSFYYDTYGRLDSIESRWDPSDSFTKFYYDDKGRINVCIREYYEKNKQNRYKNRFEYTYNEKDKVSEIDVYRVLRDTLIKKISNMKRFYDSYDRLIKEERFDFGQNKVVRIDTYKWIGNNNVYQKAIFDDGKSVDEYFSKFDEYYNPYLTTGLADLSLNFINVSINNPINIEIASIEDGRKFKYLDKTIFTYNNLGLPTSAFFKNSDDYFEGSKTEYFYK